MTVDLKAHIEKKRQEKHVKAYDEIGAALNGFSVGSVLHILSSFVATILSEMDPAAKEKAAITFFGIIMGDHKSNLENKKGELQ